MGKKIILPLLLFISANFFAQSSIPRVGAVSSKSYERQSTSNTKVELKETPKSTICFNDVDKAKDVVTSKTNFSCAIFLFENVSQAEAFVASFKNSDPNISDCSYTGVKDNFYSFDFSVKEPKDIKWYLQLFKKNNLDFVKYNDKIQSIDKALSN